ncbi:MAG TPA: hypothetical protein VH458_16035 [Vicinamibacterales bacterium]
MPMILCLLGLLLLHLPQAAGALSAVTHSDPPPQELAAAIGGTIGAGGVRATANGTDLTFWWVKELPLKAGSAASAWTAVEEGALVGAVKIPRDFRDIRGKIIKPGVYTLRYGIQPANGDHLGVSPFRDFLLLSPAAVDTDPAPHGHDGTVDLSKQTIGGSHPAVWSIDPPAATEAPLSVHTTDLGHKAVVVEVTTTRDGKQERMRFGVVLIGRIEA